ncbi:MAG TPA: helix-turn-helix transcriptional regulator [Anaerolineales bacterium]|nr:helix-turn-helix transcriptional regulator [Anaerolineales bacterium]
MPSTLVENLSVQRKEVRIETIGKRIARLRSEHGWTQEALAARIAVSRVAISHIEMDLSVPGERTITLLAGIFKLSPHELVEGTTYPVAKSDRLPDVTCCYSPLELDIALLENDLIWLTRLESGENLQVLREENTHKWELRLNRWEMDCISERELEKIKNAKEKLAGS